MDINSDPGPPPHLVAKWKAQWSTVDQAIKSLDPQSPNFSSAARGTWEQLGELFDVVREGQPPSPNPFGVLCKEYHDLGTVIETDPGKRTYVVDELIHLRDGVLTHWETLYPLR